MLQVPDEVKQATTECTAGFACLGNDGANLCRVMAAVHNDILFIDAQTESNCPYRHRFGRRTACVCPTRVAVYKQHRR